MSTRIFQMVLRMLNDRNEDLRRPQSPPAVTGQSNHYVFGDVNMLPPDAPASHEIFQSKRERATAVAADSK